MCELESFSCSQMVQLIQPSKQPSNGDLQSWLDKAKRPTLTLIFSWLKSHHHEWKDQICVHVCTCMHLYLTYILCICMTYFGYSTLKAHSWENVIKKSAFGGEITSSFICYIWFSVLERCLFFCLHFLRHA